MPLFVEIKGYNPVDTLTLKSGCSQENNILKSEAGPSLREIALNLKITSANSLLKIRERRRLRKADMQRPVGTPYEVIVNLKAEDLVEAKDQVQKHDIGLLAKKHTAALVQRDNENRSKKKCQEKSMEKR